MFTTWNARGNQLQKQSPLQKNRKFSSNKGVSWLLNLTAIIIPVSIALSELSAENPYPVSAGSILQTTTQNSSLQASFLRLESHSETFSHLNVILEDRKRQHNQKSSHDLLGSLRLQSPHGQFSAGHRDLPGLTTSFLQDDRHLSGLSGLPHARRMGSAFGLWAPSMRYPGFQMGGFGLEGRRGAGVALLWMNFWQLYFHPGAKQGALTFSNRAWNDSKTESALLYYFDLVKEPDTTGGYGRIGQGSRFLDSHWMLEFERKSSHDWIWLVTDPDPEAAFAQIQSSMDRPAALPDSNDPDRKSHWVRRRGRSGALYSAACLANCICVQAAGQDRYLKAYRVAGADLLWPLSFIPGAISIGGRYLEKKSYALPGSKLQPPDSNVQPPYEMSEQTHTSSQPESIARQTAEESRYANQMAWFGYQFRKADLLFRLGSGRGRSGAQLGSMDMALVQGGWQVSWAASLLSAGDPYAGSFLWLELPRENRAAMRFYSNTNAVLLFQVRGPFLYFYMQLKSGAHRLQSMGSLQFQLRF